MAEKDKSKSAEEEAKKSKKKGKTMGDPVVSLSSE